MSESHTPGPWTVAAGSHVCGGWGGMVRVEASEDFHSNGQDYPDGGSSKSYTNVVCAIGGHSETARANARLIAAAPDLLEACKAATKAAKDGFIPKDGSNVMRQLEAAIAKAGGAA